MLPIKTPGKSWHTRRNFPIKCLQILPWGAWKGQKGGPEGLRRGGVDPPGGWIWGALGGLWRGGDPPPGGGPGGGGAPPPGGGQKGQKVAIQGGPLGLPPRPLQIPYEKWAGWPDFDPPPGGSQGGPGGAPPLRGGDFGASRLVRGGVPPPGGPQGAKKGPKRPILGHF